jgi:hypothetical protein
MTDEAAGEIFALARDAFRGGQRNFQIQAFPFRMTPENMAKHYDNPNMDFWRMLKVGYDSFELTRTAPTVEVCEKQYVFDADAKGARFDPKGRCPDYVIPEPLGSALAQKQAADDQKFAALVVAIKNGGGTGGPLVAASRPIPAILERIGVGGGQAPVATTAATPVTTGSIPTTAVATTAPVAATPIPSPKLAPVSTTPVAAGPATPVPTLKPTQPAIVTAPGGGTIVKRKFWWDETPAPANGGA